MPPCIHNIFSSIIAAIGMLLKQSIKFFHSFSVNFLLPKCQKMYINHKSHTFCWFQLIHDFLSIRKSFMDTLVYSRTKALSFQLIVCLDPHNLLKKDNFFRVGILRSRIFLEDLGTAHEYLLLFWWVLIIQGALVDWERPTLLQDRQIWHHFMTFWHHYLFFRQLIDWWEYLFKEE